MMHPKLLSIKDFSYTLPSERIADFPCAERDGSRLLVWNEEVITADIFKNISNYLPKNSIIIFNNSKVIPARLLFKKPSGSTIEIFCLEPYEPAEYSLSMKSVGSCKWNCMVGGLAKWKEPFIEKFITIEENTINLKAIIIKNDSKGTVIEFSWDSSTLSFAAILDSAGEIPLPPYIKRKAQLEDHERYQTIFAKQEGSVAAPTAALHFTKDVIESIRSKQIAIDFVTLHVGAGTFKPVKSISMSGHNMHAEWLEVNISLLNFLLLQNDKSITVVGTTATRTIESIYWMGVKAYLNPEYDLQSLILTQWEVYEPPLINSNFTKELALTSLIDWLRKRNMNTLICQTSILIAPRYKFKLVNTLITNFHQPQSTLLLLIAAAVGEDWKKIYEYALQHNYRFLSYGDACLLKISD